MSSAKEQLAEDPHKQIVERAPMRSCLAYNGLYFGKYHKPFLETPGHSHPQHEIVTLHFQEFTQVEWTIEARIQNTSIIDSSVCFFPAHSSHHVEAQQ